MSTFARRFFLLLCSFTAILLASCESPQYAAQIEARRMQIANEPRGDYYIGRRFRIERTHFWGYLRRPGQDWASSRLVVMNERVMRQPDRLPELPSGSGPAYGFDHNHEYRIWGNYTGRRIYDPNSDLILPEFVLQRYEPLNSSPGWLFSPKEKFNGAQLLRSEPEAMPRR
jgi:hypothetical protein